MQIKTPVLSFKSFWALYRTSVKTTGWEGGGSLPLNFTVKADLSLQGHFTLGPLGPGSPGLPLVPGWPWGPRSPGTPGIPGYPTGPGGPEQLTWSLRTFTMRTNMANLHTSVILRWKGWVLLVWILPVQKVPVSLSSGAWGLGPRQGFTVARTF